MIMLLLIMICGDLLLGCSGENIDLDLHVDRENWLDPNDPFASPLSCTKNTLDELAICQENLTRCLKTQGYVENVRDSTLKHIVRNFLYRMDVDIDKTRRVERVVEVYLNADKLAVLKKYLNSKDETITAREQVREVLEEMIVPKRYEEASFMKRAFSMVMTLLPLLNTVTNIAARMSRAEKSLTEKCKADSFFSTALNMVSGLFIFKGENECEQHYKDLYVDPIYEIAPLDVICEVLSNFIFTSLGVFGRHLNIFLNEFFRDSPFHFIVMKIITFFFLVVAFLFWLGGYRIRTFFTTIEPTDVSHTTPRMIQTSDYLLGEGRQKIETSKSSITLSTLPIGLQRTCNKGSSKIRNRSLSVSR
ncbi:unnamed protein product [Litomosoides sigmodontis]|uniref:Chloride channel CLIC-like protein 1 n=1 Tax=Litomosoides sigmodontis TaxID=42156 RepID=A0A3P6SU46_LITSI|nr:unnamed protein product [Litomosoides sigmodontis]